MLAVAATPLFLVITGLWLWMARTNKRGRSWARITATVFFGLLTAGELAGLIWSLMARHSFAFLNYTFVVSCCSVYWLVALSAVVLLWQRSSSDYYAVAGSQSKAVRAAARQPRDQPAVRQATDPEPN
jgi:hypothetical protein